MTKEQRDQNVRTLRANLRAKAPELLDLLKSVSDHWGYEDPIYRFYHQSFKVFGLQEETERIVESLASLLPDQPMNSWFLNIVRDGTGKEFTFADNDRWLEVTRPIVEAFFHARYFLEMACRYHDVPDEQLNPLPSGWAAFLYLFNLR